MIINVEAQLMDAGFPEFHVKKELYWPKGKTATPAVAAAASATDSSERSRLSAQQRRAPTGPSQRDIRPAD